ncbi:hypothetical protein EVAR_97619_1 [Eumeta japonica]|uniref:Uncharacterized protein n=1 Tax=Eumeta variegata TaxID=151549 RepID=A0A4C1XKS9_EUMVA|nr:hypothetical protein EVAR_97619_1 [Eumeta japonica]
MPCTSIVLFKIRLVIRKNVPFLSDSGWVASVAELYVCSYGERRRVDRTFGMAKKMSVQLDNASLTAIKFMQNGRDDSRSIRVTMTSRSSLGRVKENDFVCTSHREEDN